MKSQTDLSRQMSTVMLVVPGHTPQYHQASHYFHHEAALVATSEEGNNEDRCNDVPGRYLGWRDIPMGAPKLYGTGLG